MSEGVDFGGYRTKKSHSGRVKGGQTVLECHRFCETYLSSVKDVLCFHGVLNVAVINGAHIH